MAKGFVGTSTLLTLRSFGRSVQLGPRGIWNGLGGRRKVSEKGCPGGPSLGWDSSAPCAGQKLCLGQWGEGCAHHRPLIPVICGSSQDPGLSALTPFLKTGAGALRQAWVGRTPDKGASGDLPPHSPNSNEVSSLVSETQSACHPRGWQPWPLGNLCPDTEQLLTNYTADSLILSAPCDHVALKSGTGH